MNPRYVAAFSLLVVLLAPVRADEGLGKSEMIENGDVKIHCMVKGEGPLLVLLHGFPDYWYTWRKQIPALAESHRVVAIDLRGFNKSSQPKGVENYALPKLVSDVHAVVQHFWPGARSNDRWTRLGWNDRVVLCNVARGSNQAFDRS